MLFLRLLSALLSICLLMLSVQSLAATPTRNAACNSYAIDLRAMVTADQAIRSWISEQTYPQVLHGKDTPRLSYMAWVVDFSNTKKLKRYIKLCGWPKASIYGKQASRDAWLLTQHADEDRVFQTQMLELLQGLVAAGDASAKDLAYLTDRVAVAQGKPQLYGTQFMQVGACGLEPRPVDDMEKVELRRKELGMPTLAAYRQQLYDRAMPRECSVASP